MICLSLQQDQHPRGQGQDAHNDSHARKADVE